MNSLPLCLDRSTTYIYCLLPYAEASKDLSQDLLGVDRASDAAQRQDGVAQLLGRLDHVVRFVLCGSEDGVSAKSRPSMYTLSKG